MLCSLLPIFYVIAPFRGTRLVQKFCEGGLVERRLVGFSRGSPHQTRHATHRSFDRGQRKDVERTASAEKMLADDPRSGDDLTECRKLSMLWRIRQSISLSCATNPHLRVGTRLPF